MGSRGAGHKTTFMVDAPINLPRLSADATILYYFTLSGITKEIIIHEPIIRLILSTSVTNTSDMKHEALRRRVRLTSRHGDTSVMSADNKCTMLFKLCAQPNADNCSFTQNLDRVNSDVGLCFVIRSHTIRLYQTV